ncbi:MAG: AAA family ATPase [Thiotrichales bacterium]
MADETKPEDSIRSISWENFRGLIGKQEIDVNADLVLIDGPNGFGKTSLMEALLLVVTGWHPDAGVGKSLCSRKLSDKKPKDDIYQTDYLKVFEKEGFVRVVTQQDELRVEFDRDGYRRPDGRWNGYFASERPDWTPEQASQLEARLIAFFQEGFRRQVFDDMAGGKTLQSFFGEMPKPIAQIMGNSSGQNSAIDLVSARINKRLNGIRSPDKVDRDKKLCGTLSRLSELIAQLEAHLPNWRPLDLSSDADPQGGLFQFEAWASGWLNDSKSINYTGPKSWRSVFRDVLKEKLDDYSKFTSNDNDDPELPELLKEKEHIEARLDRQDREWPDLDQEVTRFSHPALGENAAASLFDILAEKAHEWAQMPIPARDSARDEITGVSGLARVQAEFRRVSSELAAELASTIRAWLKPRQDAYLERQRFLRDKDEVERRLRELLASEDYRKLAVISYDFKKIEENLLNGLQKEIEYRDALKSEHENAQKRAALKSYSTALNLLDDALVKATQPSKEIKEAVVKTANSVLSHFALVDGILPIKSDQTADETTWMPMTDDGRRLDDLSTGQKAQVAVAWLAAQNLAMAAKIPEALPKILILDDVSTAYDLSNLAREALLWRQLAYGGEGVYRRQVFISSHHEDMTSNLLDLLIPPQGRTMRLVRFKDWSSESGPVIDVYAVEPSGQAWEEPCEDGKPIETAQLKQFKEALCNPLE